jgi:hypothetical protein
MVEEAGAMMQRCNQDRNKCNAKSSKIRVWYYKPVTGLRPVLLFSIFEFYDV